MAAPSIKTMAYAKLPFLASNAGNDGLMDTFTFEVYYELQGVLEKEDADVETEASYTGLERSIISDLVAISMIRRKALENMEGIAGAAASGNKIVKKGKAGGAEAEFEVVDESKGTKVVMQAGKIMQGLKSDAQRKAYQRGFILDYGEAGEWVISAYTSGACIGIFDFDC